MQEKQCENIYILTNLKKKGGNRMIHAICDFCGKDCDRVGIMLTMRPFSNFARYHSDLEPMGSQSQAKGFILCEECLKKHRLPNPYADYNGITQPLKYAECLDEYSDEELITGRKKEKK